MKKNLRIAAVGDIHAHENGNEKLPILLSHINNNADVLLLCGDLTDFGLPGEAELLGKELAMLKIPVLAVLGNHDFDGGKVKEIKKILKESKVEFLDEEIKIIGDCGFAGVKGFGGGFGQRMVSPFGEKETRKFSEDSVKEALLLENHLRRLQTKKIFVVLHYSPIEETLQGEPQELYPVLGSSRFAETIDRFRVNAVFHGHSHFGKTEGKTPKGIPVFNTALPLLRKHKKNYVLFEAK